MFGLKVFICIVRYIRVNCGIMVRKGFGKLICMLGDFLGSLIIGFRFVFKESVIWSLIFLLGIVFLYSKCSLDKFLCDM